VILAVTLVLGLAAAYLAVRFIPGQALAAAGAGALDLIVTLGLTALLRVNVGAPAVAAILAVLVYSLRDKAVVLDRVREALARKGGKRADPTQLVERALNEAAPRSALTTLAALLPLLAIAILGPAGVRGLALVLGIGFVAASFSSLFLMVPLWMELGKREGPEPTKKARPRAAAS
jgi:preprotein translocase SecF subunit